VEVCVYVLSLFLTVHCKYTVNSALFFDHFFWLVGAEHGRTLPKSKPLLGYH